MKGECIITYIMRTEMKKMLKKSCALVLSVALALTAVAAPSVADAAPKAKKIKLSVKKKTLEVGTKFTLKVKKTTPKKASKKVTWKSSKKAVAKVNKKGVVTAVAEGKATITATAKGNKKVKATCKVTVIPASVAPTTVPGAPTVAPSGQPQPSADVTPTKTPRPTQTPYPLPDEVLKDAADFTVGTVINYDKIMDGHFTALAAQQFEIVSFENEMKGYSLIDVPASQAAVAEEGEKVVKCQFDRADEMVQWAIDNGLKVRGHVLFWEASMAEAFFYKGYQKPDSSDPAVLDAALVDKATLLARMESYASQVIPHFEEKFPGTVTAWDIVNEAVDAADTATKDPATGLYLYTTGNFYKILGGEYVKYAFQYAKKAANSCGADIDLFYNDFNCFQSPKTDRIIALINWLNKDEKLLTAMGMEGYVLTYWPSASEFRSAMDKFVNTGVNLGVNEVCIRLSPQYSSNGNEVTDKDIEAHAQKCVDMFKAYKEFNEAHPGKLTNVSIWALTDRPDLLTNTEHYDYGVYGTHSGLFTEKFEAKDAFNRVIEMLKK
ncbi:MAG: hypothetical protein E7267_07575 [Lachnospiraceae bacterium]|nr:hypothetical protein [Lachnospiraceae bacterium]